MVNIRRVRAVWALSNGDVGYSNFYTLYQSGKVNATYGHATTFLTNLSTIIRSTVTVRVDPVTEILDSVTGTIINSETATSPTTVTCTDTGQSLPAQAQGLIRWRTGFYSFGRELRGKTYIPAPTEGSSDGLPLGPYITTVTNAASTFINDCTPDEPLLVWGKTHGVVAPIKAGPVSGSWHTLRGRGFKVL